MINRLESLLDLLDQNKIEEAKYLFQQGIIKAKEAYDKRSDSEMEEFLDEL
ncbi:MAG: hypothetical protein ACYCVH_12240 [Ignavibacteriaceae bacterium]